MFKSFRITSSEGISVVLEFNGDEVHIIASFSTNSTTVEPVQVKENDKIVAPDFQKGKATNLSNEQISAICEDYKSCSLHELACKYHVHLTRIRSILSENGVQIRKASPLLSNEQISSICQEYATTSIPTLAKKYHISEKRVCSILNENDVQIRKIGRCKSPLSDEQISSICQEYAITSIPALAKKYHISTKRVYSILNENGVQIRKRSQRPVAAQKASVFLLKP